MTAEAEGKPGGDASPGGHLAGKVAYGALFVIVLPVALLAWARGASRAMRFESLQSQPLGLALVGVGVVLVLSGMWALRAYGGGLPMNAFPPPRFVSRGIYALVPHPIYVGFCLAVVGVSVFTGSAAGLWLVSPVLIAATVALVLGYERHDLIARFGRSHPPTWIHLPPDADARPTPWDRASVHVLVLWPWMFVYEAIVHLGDPPDAIVTFLRAEEGWPVVQPSELVYASTYFAVALATLVAPTQASLRRFAMRGLLAMALVFPLYLTFPFIAPPRPFEAGSMWGRILTFERSVDGDGCAMPSFHVIWAVLAAAVFGDAWPRARLLARAWAFLVAVSCLTTGMHSLVDVVGGGVASLAVVRASWIWQALRRGSERVANSWREWRLGPVRIINHGLYAGLGTALAGVIVGGLAGPRSAGAIVLTVVSAVICSALWAQLVEGSSQLLRPYGYYGGVVGIIVGALLSPLVGVPTWVMLAATSVAGPWVQSVGRLRCLVQGCCHGAPTTEEIGIRYTHPRSRVTRIAHLEGKPLHPTPLYSILWNVVIAMVMGRLWSLHAPLRFIGGLYLVLTGIGRFVEESYRGEPQTTIWKGLRLYQWIAIATVVVGAGVTVLGPDGDAPSPQLSWPPMLVSLGMGLMAGAALGVDFPSSKKRFSRLA